MPFSLNVGGAPLLKSFIGSTPIKRVYAGATHVWPPLSAKVVYVASQVFSGTTNTTLPSHSAGDLLVIVSNASTPPTPPSGWTGVYTGTGSPAVTVAYRIATGAGTGTGAWAGNLMGTGYVFRNFDTTTPLGVVNSGFGLSGTAIAPAVTLTDPSGDSAVVHSFFNNGSTGGWQANFPGGYISKNANARMASMQLIDSRDEVAAVGLTHTSVSSPWRAVSFEVLAPQPVQRSGLYGVKVEYLDNYVVTLTALTTYPEGDIDEAYFFRSTPIANDGYTNRTFTKTYRSSAVPMDCVLEEYWATPSGTRNTINFQITPRAVGGGVVEEIIP